MIISSRSSRVLDYRKTIVKLMLASHPDTCMVCDKGNSCQLRTIAADIGIGLVDFQRIPQLSSIENINPFIVRDLSKCILCAKCIRADHELVVIGAIDYTGRGFTSIPATLNNEPLEKSECTFCGTCVSLCPTGALTEKNETSYGAVSKTVKTICPYCGCGCGISLELKDDRILRIRPDRDSPVNHGTLCVKGSYGYDFVYSRDRLTTPLVKTDEGFKEASWTEALGLIADKFTLIKNTHGPESIAVFGSSKCTNEENYLLQKFTRCVLGNNNIDNGSRLYSTAGYWSLGQTLGYPGSTNTLDALQRSEVLLIIGANPAESAPLVDYAIKRAVRHNGARLLVINPRFTNLNRWAHLWLKPLFGTDTFLLNGMAREIIEQGIVNEEYVERKTDHFNAFTESLNAFTPEYVEKVTGILADEVHLAARLFAEVAQASIVYGNGITQYAGGANSVIALAHLAMLTGNVTGMGCGIYALQRENNGQGACDAGALPDFLPGYQDIQDTDIRQKFEERWKCPVPVQKGLTALEMIAHAARRELKAMYIAGENPVISFPHKEDVNNALSALDFMVVQDMFMTETAKLATVVLPATSFAEKEGTTTNFEGRVQTLRAALKPPGESLPDWKIITHLSNKMGYSMPYSSAKQVMQELAELTPLYHVSDDTELDIEELYIDEPSGKHPVSRRLYKGHFPDGFQQFKTVETMTPQPASSDEYPFTLMTGSTLYHFGTGTRSSKSKRLSSFTPDKYLEMCNKDAEQLDIHQGDRVKVISANGRIIAHVRINDSLNPGMLFIRLANPDIPVNALFDSILDPKTKTPAMKTCRVKLERDEDHD
jgi:formate dehydrogenase alpha subunit